MPHVSYFWDEIEDNVVEEYDGDTGATIASYTTEPTLYGSVLSQDRSGEKRYFQFDGLGNTSKLTSESGTASDCWNYTAFGHVTSRLGTTRTPWQAAGRWGYLQDAITALLVVRRRILSACHARWVTSDPHPRASANVYVTSDNNPSSRPDPSGLDPIVLPPIEDLYKDLFSLLPPVQPSEVGVGNPGPCTIRIVGGHYRIPDYLGLKEWLDDLIVVPRDYSGCGHWFGAVACESTNLLDEYPAVAIVPGLPRQTTPLLCKDAVDRMLETVEKSIDMAKILCKNRKERQTGCPEDYLCGTSFKWCTSVQILLGCEAVMKNLLNNARCPDGSRYPGTIPPLIADKCPASEGVFKNVRLYTC